MKTEETKSHNQIDLDTAEFEAMGGKVTYYKTLDTDEIIQCMKGNAEIGVWNSSELADLEERKRMREAKK